MVQHLKPFEYVLLLPIDRIKIFSTNVVLYNRTFEFWNFKLLSKENIYLLFYVKFVMWTIKWELRSNLEWLNSANHLYLLTVEIGQLQLSNFKHDNLFCACISSFTYVYCNQKANFPQILPVSEFLDVWFYLK